MAIISVTWGTRVINVPQAYLTFISGTLYELDVDQFRLDLKDLEDDPAEGATFPDTHRHNTEVTLAGVTYARTLEIINGYTITFEDTGSPYTVRFAGANHNISDVTNYVSEVSLVVGNSAGLIVKSVGSGMSQEEHDTLYAIKPKTDALPSDPADESLLEAAIAAVGVQATLSRKLLKNRQVLQSDGTMITYDDDGTTPIVTQQVKDKDGNPIVLPAGTPARRGAPS